MSTAANRGRFDPYADALTGKEGRAACNSLIKSFPMILRADRDPALAGQSIGLLSFRLLKEPKFVDGKPVYGLMKLRGNFADKNAALLAASTIVKQVDSTNLILTPEVGGWFPITENFSACKDRLEVKTDEDQKSLYDQAAKDKQADRTKMMREIREREAELRNGKDAYDDKEGLDFYVGRRVTEIRLSEHIAKLQEQISAINAKRDIVRKSLAYLERRTPDHREVWITRYNEERVKGGIPCYVPDEAIVAEYEKFIAEYVPTEEDNPEDDTDRLNRAAANDNELPAAAVTQ